MSIGQQPFQAGQKLEEWAERTVISPFQMSRSKITKTKAKLTDHRLVINCEASNSSSEKLLPIGLGQEKDVLSTIMTPKVITIDADAKVEEALRLMVKSDVGSVIITSEDTPIGVITERDVTRFAIRGDKLLSLPLTKLMSTPIQTATPDTEIWRAFETMIKLGVRRLPIVQDGKLIDIMTEKDLTRWALRVFYKPSCRGNQTPSPSEIFTLIN